MDYIQKIFNYWCIHGTVPFIRRIVDTLKRKLHISQDNALNSSGNTKTVQRVPQMLEARFHSLVHIKTYTLPLSQTRRINVLTDSINASSLFGGVGTALIFASLLANKLGAHLRIITRTEQSKTSNLNAFLSLYRIKLEREVQFTFASINHSQYEMDISESDLFITTSWWSTAAILANVSKDKIIYLLQEDERMFYPFGDDRLQCEATLQNKDIRFLINTKLLFDHLVKNGLPHIATQGKWFEPAFPSHIFYPRVNNRTEKRKFFFYARPNNPRNLFYLGIKVIDQAIIQGILNLDEWEILLVGKDIPSLKFAHNYTPIKHENLTWLEYTELIGHIDLGLSLMYTPHPSYPPLDLVASGAVVVTNRFGNKQDLTNYSENLICADLSCESLMNALRKAQAIIANRQVREENYSNNKLLIDWQKAFVDIFSHFNFI